MRGLQRSVVGAALAALLGVSLASAERAITKDQTRLREGPSASTELVAELPPGLAVDVLGESGEWKLVRAPNGRTGYAWAKHLAPTDTTPPEGARGAAEEPSADARSLADEVHDLRAQMSALAERPAPASAADLERVRQDLDRLSAAERDLARRFEERFAGGVAPVDPAPDGTPWTTAGFLAIVVAIVLVASWLLRRQRDRRQRGRLRL